MQIKVNKLIFLETLELVSSVVDKQLVHPPGVLITIGEELLFTASDGQVFLKKTCPYIEFNAGSSIDSSPHYFCFLPEPVIQLLKKISHEEITLQLKDGWIYIKSGRGSFKTSQLDKTQLYKEPQLAETWMTLELPDLISSCVFATSDDYSRVAFTCVQVTLGKSGGAVATDGRLLVKDEKDLPGEGKLLFPKKAALLIKKLFSSLVSFQELDNHLVIKQEGLTLIALKPNVKYPEIDKFIPQHPHEVKVNRKMLLEAVERCLVFAKSFELELVFKEQLEIIALGDNSVSEILAISAPEKVRLKFITKNLLALLKSAPEEFSLFYKDYRSPIVIKQDSFTALLLPII